MNGNTYGSISRNNLNLAEEIMLSKKIQAGISAKEILKQGGFLPEERGELESIAEEGELAFEELVGANIPRAMKFTRETWQKNRSGINELGDYEQTAVKVICDCARKFDWNKGCRFGTFAHQCLQHEMLRENAKTCYALRIPEESLMQLSTAIQQAEKTPALDKLIAACSVYKSLQDPFGEDEGETEFGDILPDKRAVTASQIEEEIDKEQRLLRLYQAMNALPDEERSLLEGRMGFSGKPETLKSFVGIAAKSISGVQKKENAAVRHLRRLYFSLPLAG